MTLRPSRRPCRTPPLIRPGAVRRYCRGRPAAWRVRRAAGRRPPRRSDVAAFGRPGLKGLAHRGEGGIAPPGDRNVGEADDAHVVPDAQPRFAQCRVRRTPGGHWRRTARRRGRPVPRPRRSPTVAIRAHGLSRLTAAAKAKNPPTAAHPFSPSMRSREAIAPRERRVPSGDGRVPREACTRAGTPGQCTLPRGFSGGGGNSGAGSGAPSYPFTSPKRALLAQSWRARSMSSWVRPMKFHQPSGDIKPPQYDPTRAGVRRASCTQEGEPGSGIVRRRCAGGGGASPQRSAPDGSASARASSARAHSRSSSSPAQVPGSADCTLCSHPRCGQACPPAPPVCRGTAQPISNSGHSDGS